MADAENPMYRAILTRVLAENRCQEFFERIWDGYSVTIDIQTGNLVFGRFPDSEPSAPDTTIQER